MWRKQYVKTLIALGEAEPSDRSQALAMLAADIPDGLARDALRAAIAIEDEDQRAAALAALGAELPTSLTPDLLAAVEAITDWDARGDVVRAVIAQGQPKTSMALAMAQEEPSLALNPGSRAGRGGAASRGKRAHRRSFRRRCPPPWRSRTKLTARKRSRGSRRICLHRSPAGRSPQQSPSLIWTREMSL